MLHLVTDEGHEVSAEMASEQCFIGGDGEERGEELGREPRLQYLNKDLTSYNGPVT